MAEYERFSEAFWKNEETGETRVNWFIGIVTAGLGGLVTLATKADGTPIRAHLQSVVLAGLSALLVFGILTLARMIIRNERTDEYKHALDTIRQKFQDHFDADEVLLQYHPLGGPWDDEQHRRKPGGLLHIVAGINSMIIAIGVGVVLYARFSQRVWPILFALVSLVSGFELQTWFSRRMEDKVKERREKTKITHAGGVVFDMTQGKAHYLIIHPLKRKEKNPREKEVDTTKWVLAKGKIKPRERHGDAALREVREESGYRARIVCPVGLSEYIPEGEREKIRVKFYLMNNPRKAEDVDRDPQWHEYDIALDKLTHPSSREVLEQAEEIRKRRGL